ncbi:class I SAM-dependent methyltransferase [Candidatus Uabimicrobium sp. HlEnr_7]|uniref:class I SAM-dependent methyltransferase n=1 Tax=Candidatus Uabimicrobium helgolandensis TaxID=3095367 RepID=UPI0035581FBB
MKDKKNLASIWKLVEPPIRPSNGVMAIYKKYLLQQKSKGAKNFLLLGATPEIRSLVNHESCSLLCVDRNKEMFSGLEELVTHKGRNTFICSDWLDIKTNSPIDIVFGDGVVNMLPHDKQEQLIQVIHKVLAPQCMTMLRTTTISKPMFESAQKLFEWYRTSQQYQPVFTTTNIHLRMLWLHETQTKTLDYVEYYNYLHQLHQQGTMRDEEFSCYQKLYQTKDKLNVYYPKKDDFEQLLSKYFEIENISYGNDYSGNEYNPVYVLTKRVAAPN